MKLADPFHGRAVVLTDEDVAALQEWVDDVKGLFGLGHWTIRISPHRCDKDAAATSYILDDADESVIALDRSLSEWDPASLRHVMVHELMHCHVHPLVRLVERLIDGEINPRAEAILLEAVDREHERLVDRLGRALSKPLRDVVPA